MIVERLGSTGQFLNRRGFRWSSRDANCQPTRAAVRVDVAGLEPVISSLSVVAESRRVAVQRCW